jgi:hypothetical protein
LWNIFCRPPTGKATGTASFEVINYFCSVQNKIEWHGCVAICIDGKAEMTGQLTGLVPSLKSISYF